MIEILGKVQNPCESPGGIMVTARRYTRTDWVLHLANSDGQETDQDRVKYKLELGRGFSQGLDQVGTLGLDIAKV